MAKRAKSQSDSLELLLDAICNTFGGILFISLLVVILLQLSSGEIEDDQPSQKDESPIELEFLAEDVEIVKAQIDRLAEALESQGDVLDRFATEELRRLAAARQEAFAERKRISEEVEARKNDNQIRSDAAAQKKVEFENKLAESEDVENEIARLNEKIENERKKRRRQIRSPIARQESRRLEAPFVLQYGRLYLWYEYDDNNNRVGLNTEEFIVLGETADGVVTTPLPTAGVAVNSTPASRNAILAKLRRFDPGMCYIAVVVRPDSYGDFDVLRNLLIESGYAYRLVPVKETDALQQGGASNRRVQ